MPQIPSASIVSAVRLVQAVAACFAIGLAGSSLAASAAEPAASVLSVPTLTKVSPPGEHEARMLLQTSEVEAAIQDAMAYLRSTRAGSNADDLPDLEPYVRGLAYSTALELVNADATEPRLFPNLFPGALKGLPNPDNIYRYFAVAPELTYEITGRLGTSEDLSFQVTDAATYRAGRLDKIFDNVATVRLKTDDNGSFKITIGGDGSGDAGNHLRLPAGARQVMIRDSMADWAGTLTELRVRRTGSAATMARKRTPTAAKVAENLAKGVRLWAGVVEKYHYSVPPNTFAPPRPTGYGGLRTQFITTGAFDLSDDTALVVTLGKFSAPYFGFQLGSNWYIAYDYAGHTSSLSNKQSRPNPDGSYTYVISLRDPGVANWLDPVGHQRGVMLLRWQGMKQPLPSDVGPDVKLVRWEDLSKALPAGVPMLSVQARQQQIDLRRRQIEMRHTDLSQRR